jgi:hypothetical protein
VFGDGCESREYSGVEARVLGEREIEAQMIEKTTAANKLVPLPPWVRTGSELRRDKYERAQERLTERYERGQTIPRI